MRVALEMLGLAVFAGAQVDGCLGISMPFSAMNMRTMRGFGPIES